MKTTIAAAAALAALVLAFAAAASAATPAVTTADMGTLGGNHGDAMAVNASGQAVGFDLTASGDEHAFSWTQAGGMIDLGTLGTAR